MSAALVAELDRLRREAGLSHEELGRRAEVHRTTVGLILSGKRGLTVEVAGSLAHALSRSLSSVMTAAEENRGVDPSG